MEIKTIYLETYGCAANQNNSEILQGLLERQGFIFVSKPKLANLAIINTCIVKGPTRQRMISRIKELANFPYLIVSGCMPDVESERIKKISRKVNPKIKLGLVGTKHIKDIIKTVKAMIENKESIFISQKKEIKLCLTKTPRRKNIGITQISEGCLGNCAYCIVKLAKGKLFSYPQDKILKNVKQDLIMCDEIWITSQDNAAYGIDSRKVKLPQLLKKILYLKGNFRVRLGMMNPSSLLPIVDDIIEIYKNEKMKKFLHIPVQSGSNKILRLMNRKYNIQDFLYIIEKFRREIPNLVLSTDIIVGFPQETKEDFEKTLKLIKKIKPEVLNISKFWPMPGTIATRMKQIPVKEQKKRAIKLMNLYKKIKKR
jgi:MiaB-like tRNA modifying enzyme